MSDLFHHQTDAIVDALKTGIELVRGADPSNDLRPTGNQLGWCIGFCDAASQEFRHSDTETIAFGTIVLDGVFDNSGAALVGYFLKDQEAYSVPMANSGQAFVDWMARAKPPMPLFHDQ